jgi:hypothetical protein
MKTAALSLPLLLVLLLSSSCTGPEYPDGPFETITLYRGGGYGFCPSAGEALDARIFRKDNTWVLETTVAVPAPAGTEGAQCLDEYAVSCLVSETRQPVILTNQQIEALQEAVDAVPAKQCDTDNGLACDPCLITSVQVDGHDTDGFCCGDLNQDFASGFRGLAMLIDSFAN